MQREAPPTEEGWYALHDLRRVDWDAWRDAPERERERAIAEGVDYLERHEAVADADAGGSAVYSVLGHEADLMILHLRPTASDLDTAERAFERTALARFTERADSYVSVTEASGYTETARDYFAGEVDDDSGLARYIRARLHPEIPDEEFVSFYPMSKRRRPEQNWYDLPMEERAEHMERHGEIGRGYGGRVSQMITGSIGMDDYEWGVTLWADDLTDVKELLYEMRFDPSSSEFAEFGRFYVGRRFPPSDLGALLAGETVPTDEHGADAAPATGTETADATGGAAAAGGDADGDPAGGAHPGGSAAGDHPHGEGHAAEGDHPHGEAEQGDTDEEHGGENDEHGGEGTDGEAGAADDDGDEAASGGGRPPVDGGDDFETVGDLEERLARLGVRGGEEYDDGDFGLLFRSTADAEALAEEVDGLRSNFEHYDRHVTTTVRAEGGRSAVVSIWTARDAAETAAAFLGDLPGIDDDGRYGGDLTVDGAAATAADDEATEDGGPAESARSDATMREQLQDEGIYAGQPHGEDVYALVLYTEAEADELTPAVADLRGGFDERAGHVRTSVYEPHGEGPAAVASLWESEAAADEVAPDLAALPGVIGRPEDRGGFGTMGMFYTVQPDHRVDFLETFDEVGGLLAEMDGHRETSVLVNAEDENDMFIASRWDAREDAMAFFRSDEFAETVEWGREVLADRPRHVFLA